MRPQPLPVLVDAGGVARAVPETLGKLEALTGSVFVERQGHRSPASVGPVYIGDVFETGVDGTGLIRLMGRDLELSPEGAFELLRDGQEVVLKVRRGLVLTRMRASPVAGEPAGESVRLTLSSPFGLTRVGAAELSMKVDAESAEVDVRMGEVELIPQSGDALTLSAGKKGTLGSPRMLDEMELKVIVSSGRFELKAAGAPRFVPVNLKKWSALKAGDVVRVKEGRLNVAPADSQTRFAFLKGTEAVVGEARRGDKKETTSLDVLRGEVEVDAPQGQTTRVSPGMGLTLQSDVGGQYTLRKTASGFEVNALAGDVSLQRVGEAPVLVGGGEGAAVAAGGQVLLQKAVASPVLVPAKKAVRVYHSGLHAVSLSWDDDEHVKDWRVQVASDAAFTQVVRDGVVHRNFVNVPAPQRGQWFWRVWKGEEEYAAGRATFAPEPQAGELSRLKNMVREGAEVTTIFYQDKDKPPAVTFTWARDEAAIKYAVKVYRDGSLSEPLIERVVSDAQLSLPDNRLVEGQYWWSVVPLDAQGVELRGGRMNKLQMIFDNAVEALRITAPRSGEPFHSVVRAAGIVPVGSRLSINGKAIPLDEQARFDAKVNPLSDGQIVFRLVHGGVETYTVRTLKRSR